VRQPVHLNEKAGGGLRRMSGGGIPSWQQSGPKMRDAFESCAQTPGKQFASPDRAVVSISRTVKANADDAVIPRATFGQHRSDVGAMMLDSARFRSVQPRCLLRGNVLRVSIVDHEQAVAP